MLVSSTTGERIGKIIRLDTDTFVVEKGMFFPKDYQLRYDHISDVENGAVSYSLGEAERLYSSTATEKERGAYTAETERLAAEREGLASERERRASEPERLASSTAKEVRIPLMREELDVEKFSRESGHVRIHKEVKVEERHFTVPLQHEEVVIEHVAATDGARPRDASFEDQIVDIPLYEEDVRIGKHAVLKEEVVVRTVSQSVDTEEAASLRSEDIAVEDTRQMRLPKTRERLATGPSL
jgi:uncharacterized protein (TIGR02271 family)